MEYYDFESDMDYQMQLHETLMSRTAVEYNKRTTDEYFQKQITLRDLAVELTRPDQITYSVQQFLSLFQAQQLAMPACINGQPLVPSLPPPPVPLAIQNGGGIGEPSGHEHLMLSHIVKNLKQRIADVIKERNAHYKLKRQVAIMDAVHEILDQDPLKMLVAVGYQAIVRNDEFNIPPTAKNLDPHFAQRYERKRQQLAESFCLLQLCQEVIHCCDTYDDNNRVAKPPLYAQR